MLRQTNNLYDAFKLFMEKVRGGQKYNVKRVNEFNYTKVIKQALKFLNPHGPFDMQHNFFVAQQMQIVGEQKWQVKAGCFSDSIGTGFTMKQGADMDRFILTRKSNYAAELIFNQNPVQDFNKKIRFFEIDHEMKWKLSDNASP